MPKFLNPWNQDPILPKYFVVDNPVYSKGDFVIYKQADKCFLYTYKDLAITQLGGINKPLIENLISKERPAGDESRFLFDRAQSRILKHYPED